MVIEFFVEADNAEQSKEIVNNKLSILNVNNIVFCQNEKYWKIETLYVVLISIEEEIEEQYFRRFLNDIAYDWLESDIDLVASQTAEKHKIKENNSNIEMVVIYK